MDEREVTNTLLANGKVLVSQKGSEFDKVLVEDVTKRIKKLMTDKDSNVHLSSIVDDKFDTQIIVIYATK